MEIKIKIQNHHGEKETISLGNPENNSYIKMLEFNKRLKDMIYSVPIEYAFGREQEDEMLRKWGLTRSKEDLDKIVETGYGGYALKTDIPKIQETYEKAKRMEIQFFDRNHAAFAEKVLYEFTNYASKPDALKTIHFTPNEENEKIVKEVWKAMCRKTHYTYRCKWIETVFSSLQASIN